MNANTEMLLFPFRNAQSCESNVQHAWIGRSTHRKRESGMAEKRRITMWLSINE